MKHIIFWICVFLYLMPSMADAGTFTSDTISTDSLTKKQERKVHRQTWRHEFRHKPGRFIIRGNYVFAHLKTIVTTDIGETIFKASISLEENLNLPDQKNLVTGSFICRVTPRSGFFLQYYGLDRSQTNVTDQDYIFLEDTVPAGTRSQVYFNTQVYGGGYVLTVMEGAQDFLGVYFNVYLMDLNTGIATDYGDLNPKIDVLLPFPNIGLIAIFKLSKRFYFDGNIGFIVVNRPALVGSMYDFNVGYSIQTHKMAGPECQLPGI